MERQWWNLGSHFFNAYAEMWKGVPSGTSFCLYNNVGLNKTEKAVLGLLIEVLYVTQVVRMFDKDMHKEYLFLNYLIGLIPADPVEPVDLDGKLKLEYYKFQKTFSGAIQLDNLDGRYVPAKQKAVQGKKEKSTLDEIIEKINERYKGDFTDADRVMLSALHDKLRKDE